MVARAGETAETTGRVSQLADSIASAATLARVAQAYAAATARHPELRRPLTWNGARAILRRERIPLVMVPLIRPAALISSGGVSVLMLNSNIPPRRHTHFVAHELAHHWLHGAGDEGTVYHMATDWPDDPREDEAEILAALLLGGPRFAEFLPPRG